jgi:hypothetical protein
MLCLAYVHLAVSSGQRDYWLQPNVPPTDTPQIQKCFPHILQNYQLFYLCVVMNVMQNIFQNYKQI